MGIGPGKRIALQVRPGIEVRHARVHPASNQGDDGLGRRRAGAQERSFAASVRPSPTASSRSRSATRCGSSSGRTSRRRSSTSRLGRHAESGAARRWPRSDNSPPNRRPLTTGRLTTASDPAAIVFTSGSTGPPKGVLYTHRTFVTQCSTRSRRQYDIRPGDVDLACFPLFGLFNVACGVTTVLPEMDFSRPASCDPKESSSRRRTSGK